MKLKERIFVAFFVLLPFVLVGNVVRDTVKLGDLVSKLKDKQNDQTSINLIVNILKPYSCDIEKEKFTSAEEVSFFFIERNPFLFKVFRFEGIASNINVTSIESAISQHLANQFRVEMDSVFFNNFRKKIKKFEELQIVLPNVYDVLSKNNPYDFQKFLSSLRYAAECDASNSIKNINSLFEKKIEELSEYRNDRASAYCYEREGYFQIHQILKLVQSIKSNELLHYLDNFDFSLILDKNSKLLNAVNLVQVFSRILKNGDKKQWVSNSEIKKLITKSRENKKIPVIFLGLLYSREGDKLEEIEFGDGFDLIGMLESNSGKVIEIIPKIIQLSKRTERLINELKVLESFNSESAEKFLKTIFEEKQYG